MCPALSTLITQVRLRASEALSFLNGFLETVEGLQADGGDGVLETIPWMTPCVCIDLPVLSGPDVHLEPFREDDGRDECLASFQDYLCRVSVL